MMICPICECNNYKEYGLKKGCLFVECSNCKVVYQYNFPSQDEVTNIYDENYFFGNNKQSGAVNYLNVSQQMRLNFHLKLEQIEKIVKPGKVLDVGCGPGFFLNVARERGWQPFGLEISKAASKYAREVLKLSVVNGNDPEILGHPPGSFTLITLWHTLEHLLNPIEVLSKLNNLLSTNGIIVVEVPDIGSLPAKIKKTNWQYLKPQEHLVNFSKISIDYLFKETGFVPFYYEPTSLTHLLTPMKKLPKIRKLILNNLKRFFWIKKTYLRIKSFLHLHDCLMVYARKK